MTGLPPLFQIVELICRFSGTITPSDNMGLSIRDRSWSKEALFGLLGVIVVVIVPCIGPFFRHCIRKYRASPHRNHLLEVSHIALVPP